LQLGTPVSGFLQQKRVREESTQQLIWNSIQPTIYPFSESNSFPTNYFTDDDGLTIFVTSDVDEESEAFVVAQGSSRQPVAS
jgi:hypothetical protein